MIPQAISKLSIVKKQTIMVILIFVLVAGILAVNAAIFFNVKDSMEEMIDRGMDQITDNSRLKGQLNISFSEARMLIHTFTEREKTLRSDQERIVEALQENIQSLVREENNLQYSLQDYTRKLNNLLNKCTEINETLGDLYRIQKSLNSELTNLDDIVVEKEILLDIKNTEEEKALKQLGFMLPAYREIYFQIITQLNEAVLAYLNEEAVNVDYEHLILSSVDEFHAGLMATTVTWKEIAPRIKNLNTLGSEFSTLIPKLFDDLGSFAEIIIALQLSEEKVMVEIGVLDENIVQNTEVIKLKTAENLTSGFRTTTLLSALIIGLLLIIGFFTVRLVQPIKQLNIGAKKVGSGDLDFKVKVESNDEIGQLAESFNQMIDDLRESTVSKEYLENIINSMIDTLIVLTPDGKIQQVNQAACDLLGYKAEELIGQPFKKIFKIEAEKDEQKQDEKQRREIERLTQGGSLREIERAYTARDGSIIPILFSGSAIRDRNGKVEGIVCVALDITDRKRAEDALKESESKYRQMVENVPTGIYEMDIEALRFTKVNDVMCDVLGYTEEELLALDPMDIFTEDSKKLMIERAKIAKAGEKVAPTVEYKIITKDGREIWALVNSKITYKNGKPVHALVVAQDISERKTLEAQLIRAQKMEAIGTLAGGIAHDFNNLLMSIQGYASLMLFDLDSTHPHYEPLQNIEKQIRSAAQLTAQLLGYARKGKYHVQTIDLHQLVAETSDTFGRARKEIYIHHEGLKDLHPIEADRGQMEQVLLNLYVNAADAMLGGGKLILETSNVTHEDMKGKMYDPKPGSYVLLRVIDNGTGMGKTTQERIFDPFFTTKEMGKGTGLGLASVYGIIKGHGGYIDVYSELGRGTTFQIYLPASDKEADTKPIEKLIDVNIGSETILLVEDEEVVLDVGIKMLGKMGYTVLAAKSGEEAIVLYKEKQDSIDMVVLDMVLPEMGGGEVYDALKEINPDVRVLLASGYSIDSQAKQILSRGCNGFIQKPFNLSELSAKIKEIL
jgi:PAS domain S-box-containing protein